MKIKFDNLHPTKKHAFLDGLLCGILFAWMARGFYEAAEEDRHLRNLAERIDDNSINLN